MLTINSTPIKQIGYGAMVLEGYYGASEDQTAVETLTYAIEQNMMIDTADAYGAGHNESLLKQAIQQSTQTPFVATKFGIVFEEDQTGHQIDTGWGFPLTINGTRSYVKRAIDNSLERLGVNQIDLLYAHYLDPSTSLEETVSAMAEAVQAGKVKAIGLSNVTAEEIIQANQVHPISAVQYEYSLFRREAETDILPAINSISASLVCWSPLGAGFLTGTVKQLDDGDFRTNNPKMQGENLSKNLQRLEDIKKIALDLNITPAQLALAWLIAQGDNIIPIPGSRKKSRIDENLAALGIQLSAETLRNLDEIAPIGAFQGATLV
ncbi:aldo/keto reductase [Acaryochloris marina]|uniref:Aldo/keto reductase, putative n=1 Tax=Acaryochloris marina (strain MBIC 11017) TaxID=329726 RepID=B0C5G4_ACAM1|nr:aldo/keto reductase [Acaryochloris marina]ABW27540.1 aldo/keto reductase, putative [Acaryochloris marina MBIC11017]BDM82276.1 aldo/keto reductase [Acaryochloris marina MBIC10699]